MGKGLQYLQLSGFMENTKGLVQSVLKSNADFQKLPAKNQSRYISAFMSRFLPKYEVAAGDIVEKRFPPETLDKCIEFLNSDAGRSMVYHQMLAISSFKETADRIMKQITDELLDEEEAEEKRIKDQQRKDRRESKGKK